MRTYYWASVPPFKDASGAAFNTFTTFQQIYPSTTMPCPVIPANLLETGSEIKLTADGEFSTTGTPTLGLGFIYGAATPLTTLAVGTPLLTITGATSWPWHAEGVWRVREPGSAGTLQGAGWWMIGISLTTFSAQQAMPATSALRTITFDTTANNAFAPGAVWGTSSVSNTIKVDRFTVTVVT